MWSATCMYYLKGFYSATQVPALDIIKMFLDDSLHHTYNYVDQPYTYFCCHVTLGH